MITLPKKKSPIWLVASFVTTIINAVFLFLAIFIISLLEGRNIFNSTMFVILLIIAIINLLYAFVGFLGAKNTFFYGNYALLFGSFLAGAYLTQDIAGWQYFTSAIMIILFTGFGMIIGIVFDLIGKKHVEGSEIEKRSIRLNKVLMGILTVLLILPLVLSIKDIN